MRLRGHQLDGFNAALKSGDAAKAHQELQTACARAEGIVPFASASGSAARIEELEAEVKRLRKYEQRLNWLHQGGGETDRDAEGYEWGVARIKFDAHGQVTGALWTNSDHSDLDAEMERAKPLND